MYTGRIQIVTEGVEDLLKVADMFDIQEVREACTDTLIRNLCPDNCISESEILLFWIGSGLKLLLVRRLGFKC